MRIRVTVREDGLVLGVAKGEVPFACVGRVFEVETGRAVGPGLWSLPLEEAAACYGTSAGTDPTTAAVDGRHLLTLDELAGGAPPLPRSEHPRCVESAIGAVADAMDRGAWRAARYALSKLRAVVGALDPEVVRQSTALAFMVGEP
ncbi:MAG: hypothetical protein Q8Q14_00590 [Gemmatimonadales bacterium]|nr:hypothetical protein [Gemmatimonadales bacterium]